MWTYKLLRFTIQRLSLNVARISIWEKRFFFVESDEKLSVVNAFKYLNFCWCADGESANQFKLDEEGETKGNVTKWGSLAKPLWHIRIKTDARPEVSSEAETKDAQYASNGICKF